MAITEQLGKIIETLNEMLPKSAQKEELHYALDIEDRVLYISNMLNDISANGGLGITCHVCTSSEYDHTTGVPTVEDPDEGVVYITPNGDSAPNSFNEYFYVENAWELFGSATIVVENSDWNESDNTSAAYILNKPAIASGTGSKSIVEGHLTVANKDYAHAEGVSTTASGYQSHAEGNTTTASGINAHAEGNETVASGLCSHSEGYNTTASNTDAHAEGWSTTASGSSSHAEGYSTTASGNNAHAEGSSTTASGNASHSEGNVTIASGTHSHVEGCGASIDYAGNGTEIQSESGSFASHAEGYGTLAKYSADPTGTNILYAGCHAEGSCTYATGGSAHSEGYMTKAVGNYAHAEGYQTKAIGNSSHSEGSDSSATGTAAHVEGDHTQAPVANAHAEGYYTVASGTNSHAEGDSVTASQLASHAEGCHTGAHGSYAHAEGYYTAAVKRSQHVFGEYNVYDPGDGEHTQPSDRGLYVEIVGNGTNSASSNARTLDWDGNEWLAGGLTVASGKTITIGSTSITEAQLIALLALLN